MSAPVTPGIEHLVAGGARVWERPCTSGGRISSRPVQLTQIRRRTAVVPPAVAPEQGPEVERSAGKRDPRAGQARAGQKAEARRVAERPLQHHPAVPSALRALLSLGRDGAVRRRDALGRAAARAPTGPRRAVRVPLPAAGHGPGDRVRPSRARPQPINQVRPWQPLW